jgi:hypothetical protein
MQEKSDEDTFSELKYQMLSNIYSTWGLISHDTGSTVDLFHLGKKTQSKSSLHFLGHLFSQQVNSKTMGPNLSCSPNFQMERPDKDLPL